MYEKERRYLRSRHYFGYEIFFILTWYTIINCITKFLRSKFTKYTFGLLFKIIYYTIAFPFLVLGLLNEKFIDPTITYFSYNDYIPYEEAYRKSYIKGFITFLIIISSIFWVPFVFGAISWIGSEHPLLMGFGYMVFFCTFISSFILPILGIIAAFAQNSKTYSSMRKYGHELNDRDAKVTNSITDFEIVGIGIHSLFNRRK